jgi:hypothetical protein
MNYSSELLIYLYVMWEKSYLRDDWFRKAVRETWSEGTKLIPPKWNVDQLSEEWLSTSLRDRI